MSDTDMELLARYTRQHAEDAFAEIVRRHLGLVYSAALRQVRSPQLAEEVAQSVFTDLARSAAKLKSETVLTAWLYQVTRRTAIDVVRREASRQLREQIATEMNAMNATAADWTHIEPLLDEAMHALDDTDRTAVLLRYFENRSLREVGALLGASENAAQKRLVRAIERLREFFAKRGVAVGAGGLVVVISANAVQAAPIGLSAAITTTAALGGKAITATTIAAATKAVTMTILQKTLVTAIILATLAAGTGAYIVHHQNANRVPIENRTEFPKDSWADAGFATPQAALRTRGWAVLTGNRERFKESLFITDGARAMIQEMIAATPISEADKKLHPEFLNMTAEDATLFPMMGQNKRNDFTGYRILSQQSLSADETLLDVETQMVSAPARKEALKFRRLGRDWKVVVDEDSVKEDYKKFQRMTSRRIKSER
jgi:RNA polymerase sigma factor (sigma-70 family)